MIAFERCWTIVRIFLHSRHPGLMARLLEALSNGSDASRSKGSFRHSISIHSTQLPNHFLSTLKRACDTNGVQEGAVCHCCTCYHATHCSRNRLMLVLQSTSHMRQNEGREISYCEAVNSLGGRTWQTMWSRETMPTWCALLSRWIYLQHNTPGRYGVLQHDAPGPTTNTSRRKSSLKGSQSLSTIVWVLIGAWEKARRFTIWCFMELQQGCENVDLVEMTVCKPLTGQNTAAAARGEAAATRIISRWAGCHQHLRTHRHHL